MRVTHLGHSCLLVESSGIRVLLDPGTFSHGFEELTGLAAVLVTHQHVDHLDVERLPQLLEANDGARVVVEPETAAELGRAGIEAQALHPGEELVLAGLNVSAVGGRHALVHDDVPRVGNVGYVLAEESGPRLFHPGDAIDTAPEAVDVLALPLSAPWAALKETVEFLRAVSPRAWFPIHDGLLSAAGRSLYLRVGGSLGPDGAEQLDLAGAGAQPF
ncbi:MAG: MBL fold metallo-hydrolase [Kineosporiaceae bacterium]|jgi:L-ascorbate metabolism protein UlaG (beta-lactamase superfamily)